MFCAFPGAAQPNVDAIREAQLIDVPFVIGETDTSHSSGKLWAKGKRPENLLLADFTILPLEVATTDWPDGKVTLWRAFPGGGVRNLSADMLRLDEGPRYFCTTGPDYDRPGCYIDQDGDGFFDQIAAAITERGDRAYHITVMKKPADLPKPQSYQILADAMKPAVSMQLRNCGKDYDRPRYSARSVEAARLSNLPMSIGWHDKNSSFRSCRLGRELKAPSAWATAIPEKGYLAQIGSFAFAVGPKKDARLSLLGPVHSDGLYRLEGATLVNMTVGPTPDQARLIAQKQFPYPMLMADENIVIASGGVTVGQPVASVPFRHAYRGALTSDVSISTLLSSRSLPAGTVVYGFPSQSRIKTTVNGFEQPRTVHEDDIRDIELSLTWCAPVKEEQADPDDDRKPGRNGWSAACVPYSGLGNHTIITDRQPAFAVSRLGYDVNTSSNDGKPPIERDDSLAFAKPLRIDYIFDGREDDFILLSERIFFGGELTSVQVERLYAPAGKVLVEVAGGIFELETSGANTLVVRSIQPPIAGFSPLLKWDNRALLAKQLARMGLTMRQQDGDDGGADDPASAENEAVDRQE